MRRTSTSCKAANRFWVAEESGRLQKTYRDAVEIEEDVDALHTSINSLIESLGLDPNVIELTHEPHSQEQSAVNPNDTVLSAGGLGSDMHMDPSVQDFDFDQFLTDLSRHGGDENADYTQFADKLDPSTSTRSDGSAPINGPSPEQLNTFLDEVQSTSDGTVSPIASFRHDSPEAQPKRGIKRKTDVAGVAPEEHIIGKRSSRQPQTGTKAKRKR